MRDGVVCHDTATMDAFTVMSRHVPLGGSSTAPRKPFAAIRKGLVNHVLAGRLPATRLGLYLWLHLQADHRQGTVWTNASRLGGELRTSASRVRRELVALRRAGYVRYASMKGSRQLYEITIEKYHAHFGAAHDAAHDMAHDTAHERPVTAGNSGEFPAPKKKGIRMDGGQSAVRPRIVATCGERRPGSLSG